MKKEPPTVIETILWVILAIFLVWFLTVGIHRDDTICDKIHRVDSNNQSLECEQVNFKEMT